MRDINLEIDNIVKNNPVTLFMKGTKDFPQCGFSAVVVQILKNLNVDFFDINILTDPELRQGIKEYSDWPTIPQLYINGEFVGGCDIVKEMFQSQELQNLLKEKNII
jgi:monothiol glutaredoxin